MCIRDSNRAFNKLKRSEIVRGIDARIIRAQQLNKPKYKKFFITVKEYLLSLWEMLNEVGDEKKLSAFDNWDKAYNQKKNDPFIIDTVGWGYYLIGDYVNAENFLRKAMSVPTISPSSS